MVELRRTTFETSRAAEYFDPAELTKQTGQPARRFVAVALKELGDNALDACEAAGVAPEIGIEVRDEAGVIRLAVSDNGTGMPPETVEKVLDYDVRVSDKAAYRSPTRGAQGNALKTVVGIPPALGSEGPVVIEACGVRHEVRAWVDPAGELRLEHDKDGSPRREGTLVSLAVPAEGQRFDPGFWARSFALFNPHAAVRYRAKGDVAGAEEIYRPTEAGLKKYRPADPTSAHWYGEGALRRLVFSHIAEHRRGGRDLPLGEFVRQFRGLSGSRKAKAVADGIGGVSHLSGFERCPEAVGELLAAMREHSKAPSHAVLGAVGEGHFRACFERAHGVEEFAYRKAKGRLPSGLPFVFEVAVAVVRGPGDLHFGVNFSPTFGDPLEGTTLRGPKYSARGIEGFLREGHALPERYFGSLSPAETAVAVHVVTPAPMFMDRGKTRLQLEEDRDR